MRIGIEVQKNLGKNIQMARKRAGLTQAELAKKLGVATGTVQQYELGKRCPSLERLKEILNVVGMSDYIVNNIMDINAFIKSNDSWNVVLDARDTTLGNTFEDAKLLVTLAGYNLDCKSINHFCITDDLTQKSIDLTMSEIEDIVKQTSDYIQFIIQKKMKD